MFLRLIFLAIILLSTSSISYAQVIPVAAEATVVDRNLNEKEPFTPPKELKLPRTLPDVKAPLKADEIIFTPRKIIIEGNTVYSDEELKYIYKDMIDKKTSLSYMFDIASKITDKYQKDGYLLSFAVVPAQEIEDTVRIAVIEGFIDNVSFDRDIKGRNHLFDKWKEKITSQRPINKETLENVILLAERLAGTSVETFIAASKSTAGASNLKLALKHKYLSGSIDFNNHGSRFAGPVQEETVLAANSALGFYEKIQFRNIDTLKNRESQYREGTVSTMINALGTSANLLASQNKVRPGFTLANTSIESITRKFVLSVTHPIILTQKKNLAITGNAEAFSSETKTLGVQTSEDDLRVIRVGVNYSDVGDDGTYHYASAQYSQGLNIFGSKNNDSNNLSRANGHTNFGKINVNGGYNYMITNRIAALFTAKGQWAGSQLLSSEEFYFGGRQFGRGYDSSELVGDHGVAGAVELAYYGSGSVPFKGYKLYSFIDTGMTWKIDGDQQDDRKAAASAGLGAKVDFMKGISVNLEGNRPLNRDAAFRGRKDEEDIQFLADLRVNF